MLGFLRARLTYANVVATLALFVALGGSAAAALVVSSNSQIAPNTIYGANLPAGKNKNIVGGSIGSSDLASSAVVNSKLAAGAVGSDKLADKAVIAGKLGDGAVTQSNMANGAVAASKLAAGAVSIPKLGTDVLDRIDSHTGTLTQFTGTAPTNASRIVRSVAGMDVIVACYSDGEVDILVQTVGGSSTLQASGISTTDTNPPFSPVMANGDSAVVIGGGHAAFDIVARNTAVGRGVRLDMQASDNPTSGCPYWGVVQLAS